MTASIMVLKGEMPVFSNPSEEKLKSILGSAKTIAVVGLSDNPERSSYGVAQELQRRGYRIIPVNPQVEQVLGEKAYASLLEVEEHIDIVDVFRRSEFLKGIVEESIQVSAPVVWAQEEVYDEAAANLAQEHGITMVMDACIAVAHSRLIGVNRRDL